MVSPLLGGSLPNRLVCRVLQQPGAARLSHSLNTVHSNLPTEKHVEFISYVSMPVLACVMRATKWHLASESNGYKLFDSDWLGLDVIPFIHPTTEKQPGKRRKGRFSGAGLSSWLLSAKLPQGYLGNRSRSWAQLLGRRFMRISSYRASVKNLFLPLAAPFLSLFYVLFWKRPCSCI